MKERNNRLLYEMSSGLMALAFCLQAPLGAQASDIGELKTETAAMDVAKSSDVDVTTSSEKAAATATPTSPSESASKTLFGSARKHDTSLDPATDPAKLEAEKAAADAYKLAAQKLSRGEQLSSDEYRSLGVGIAGFEAVQTYFQKYGKVTEVYADSPAEQAGMRVGDKLVSKEENPTILAQEKADPTIPTWQVQFGKVGSPVDVTILRHNKPVTLTLIKMNMEDIKEPKFRHQWEKIIRELGYPQAGTFAGTSLHNLSETK